MSTSSTALNQHPVFNEPNTRTINRSDTLLNLLTIPRFFDTLSSLCDTIFPERNDNVPLFAARTYVRIKYNQLCNLITPQQKYKIKNLIVNIRLAFLVVLIHVFVADLFNYRVTNESISREFILFGFVISGLRSVSSIASRKIREAYPTLCGKRVADLFASIASIGWVTDKKEPGYAPNSWYALNINLAPRAEANNLNYKEIPEEHHSNPVLSRFICPITKAPIRFPVTIPNLDGGVDHHFERSAIVRWLMKHSTSPLTRHPLELRDLRENIQMRATIENEMKALHLPL